MSARFRCPGTPAHGWLEERPRERQSREQRWCGTWYDCQHCHSGVLVMSPELRAQLAAQEAQLRARAAL